MSDLMDTKRNGKFRVESISRMPRTGGGFGYFRTVITALTFTVGVVASLLFQNLVGAEMVSFSTIGLVGFIVAVSLSVAAIVVAIAVVAMGQAAQRALKLQAEESMHMQNEILNRTIDVLLKVETAVTVPIR